MRREGRLEGEGLAGVGADRLDAPAVDVPLLDQELDAAALGPGTCGPSSFMLRNFAGSVRFDQSVRISTQAPSGIRPFFASKAWICDGSQTKFSSAAASFEQSITTAGAMKRFTGIVSVPPSL